MFLYDEELVALGESGLDEALEGAEYDVLRENFELIVESIERDLPIVLSEEEKAQVSASVQAWIRDAETLVKAHNQGNKNAAKFSKVVGIITAGFALLFAGGASTKLPGSNAAKIVGLIGGLIGAYLLAIAGAAALSNKMALRAMKKKLEKVKVKYSDDNAVVSAADGLIEKISSKVGAEKDPITGKKNLLPDARTK